MFTIAHRLATIMDYDKVMVMDKGKVVEYNEPFLLLVKNPEDKVMTNNGVFAKMVTETGEESSKALFYTA